MYVFGGAFDPLHNGHMDMIQHIQLLDNLTMLMLIPTGVSVTGKEFYFSKESRLRMVQSQFHGDKTVQVLAYELKKSEPSFMIETIEYLNTQYPSEKIRLVLGYDQLLQFHLWKDYQQ